MHRFSQSLTTAMTGVGTLLLALTVSACSEDSAGAGTDTTTDTAVAETTTGTDAATADTTVGPDAAVPDTAAPDASAPDVSTPDSTGPDAAPVDVEPADVGPADVPPADVGPADVSPVDTAPTDTGPADVGPVDVPPTDSGPEDVPAPDSGPEDVGLPDVGPPDVPVDTGPPPPDCEDDDACDGDTPLCDTELGECVPLPRGHQIGWRDGSADSVNLIKLMEWNIAFEATDLEFHPTRNELWVVNRTFNVPGQCSQSNPQSNRCASLGGWVTVIFNPGSQAQQVEIHEDGNAWHFMRRPPAMAMGAADTWATCGEALTGNFEDNPVNFIGPSLWSSNLNIFGPGPPALNGSHLDMLHATPLCMGIAHESANVYWTLNGLVGSIDRYDFAADHGPGNDDHSDGTIFRYATGEFSRTPGVPSHMEFHAADGHLYVADTGNGRIVKLDTTSGTQNGVFSPIYEVLADSGLMVGATVTEVVPPGTLTQPSGLIIHDDLIFVTDSATSSFHAFELDGTLVNSLETDFPAGTLSGLAMSPSGSIFFSSMKTGEVFRLVPQ